MGSKQSGRKLRLTREVHATIVKHLRAGAFKRHAAEAAGVSYEALKDWLKRGSKGEKRFTEFFVDVRQAEAEDAIRNQAAITRAALVDRDWRAAAWSLERKYPDLYGRNTAAIGVSVEQPGDADGGKARMVIYIPDNGRGLPGRVYPTMSHNEAGELVDADGKLVVDED